jgi:glycerol-3-phosphate acyltransferase PlsY
MTAALAVVISYLVGAIPWGLLVGKLARGVDVRRHGSGKTGMTNVLRTVGTKAAAAVLVVDVGKGVLAVALARLLTDSQWAEVAAALAALIGHNWSVFIRFQGGRGTAPGFGGLLLMAYPANIAAAVIALPAIAVTRYVSLGSVIGVSVAMITTAGLVALGYTPTAYLVYLLIGGAIILVQHRENIQRLLQGRERKLGQTAEPLESRSAVSGEER